MRFYQGQHLQRERLPFFLARLEATIWRKRRVMKEVLTPKSFLALLGLLFAHVEKLFRVFAML